MRDAPHLTRMSETSSGGVMVGIGLLRPHDKLLPAGDRTAIARLARDRHFLRPSATSLCEAAVVPPR